MTKTLILFTAATLMCHVGSWKAVGQTMNNDTPYYGGVTVSECVEIADIELVGESDKIKKPSTKSNPKQDMKQRFLKDKSKRGVDKKTVTTPKSTSKPKYDDEEDDVPQAAPQENKQENNDATQPAPHKSKKVKNTKESAPQESTQEDGQAKKSAPQEPKQEEAEATKYAPQESAQEDSSATSSQETKREKSTKKSRKAKRSADEDDLAVKFEGTYIGTGTLILGLEEIEEFQNICVIITRTSVDIVEVSVVDKDGEVMGSSLQYKVTKDGSTGGVVMICEKDESKTITIDSNFNLTYINPSVKLDDVTYTLCIEGVREK